MSTPIKPIPGIIQAPPQPYEFIGIMGEGGVGKTHFACQFPNPLILDFDKKPFPNVDTVPFWDDAFCRTLVSSAPGAPANRRDALKAWLKKYGKDLAGRTVILDSWSSLMDAFSIQQEFELPRDSGKDSVFAFYRKLKEYALHITETLKSLPCNVIVLIHEMPERDSESGNPTGKIKPSMEGSFADVLTTKFTDYFRLVVSPTDFDPENGQTRKDSKGQPIKFNENYGRFLQIAPNRSFVPVLGHRKSRVVTELKKSYIPATYAAWKENFYGGPGTQ
jgi:hypothetical protein